MKIGLIREWKVPSDKRAALSPEQCLKLKEQFPSLSILIESSPDRIFSDEAYRHLGFNVQEDMQECDILMGIKEVPVDKLISGKTYLFFSHTTKEQPYNRQLLQAILEKNITLIDYEALLWPKGGRVLGFGKWAGIVGVYNAFLCWGKKYGLYELPPAYTTSGYEECMERLGRVDLPPIKIAFTGNGRVAQGIRETLELMQIPEASSKDYLERYFPYPVFVQLKNEHLYEHKDGRVWDRDYFHHHHPDYQCKFKPYATVSDLLINGMFWEDDMAPLFNKEDSQKPDFRISVIADISCDVEGAVPITLKVTHIYDPVFGWSIPDQKIAAPYGENTIDIMAVTNLPTELPKDASEEFGSLLLKHVLPLLILEPKHDIIEGAVIARAGKLNLPFLYLQDYVSGLE